MITVYAFPDGNVETVAMERLDRNLHREAEAVERLAREEQDPLERLRLEIHAQQTRQRAAGLVSDLDKLAEAAAADKKARVEGGRAKSENRWARVPDDLIARIVEVLREIAPSPERRRWPRNWEFDLRATLNPTLNETQRRQLDRITFTDLKRLRQRI